MSLFAALRQACRQCRTLESNTASVGLFSAMIFTQKNSLFAVSTRNMCSGVIPSTPAPKKPFSQTNFASPDAYTASLLDNFDPQLFEHEPRPDLVDKYVSKDNMSKSEIAKSAKETAKTEFRRHEHDCGSSEVQAALLSQRIKQMEMHLKVHRKDYSSQRGLESMIHRRRKLLTYLRQDNFERYTETIAKLGLKDVFIKLDRYAKYAVEQANRPSAHARGKIKSKKSRRRRRK